MDSLVFMELLSKEYGWYPSQIRKERASDMFAYWDISNLRKKVEREEAEEQTKEARRQTKRNKK